MATDLQVNIASEFKGKKAFTDAEKALNKLSKGAKTLAGALGVAYGTKAILAYGKASMKAAADDQKAQKILAQNLKNVGLAYASVDAESFIKSMETQTAVLDDQLRPAYGQLAQVTGSATKTQELMKLAFDVSSGSGLDYASTVDILSQAYIGNTKGLKQLNLGLTQAELKAMDFEQISTKLRQNFAGAGGVALDSYAGSMAKLSVATSNASETIGTALLDAVIKISGSQGVDGLISKIDTLASAFASVVTQVGNAVSALTGTETRKAFSPSYYISGGKAGGKTVGATGAGNMALSVLSQDTQKSDLAAKKKAELDAIKRNKELAALAKSQAKSAADQLKAKKDQAALDKAALVRLTVKQDILKLEDAIAARDVEGATALAAKLNKDLMILGTLQGQALKLADINNILNSFKPKDLINLENLNQALALLAAMAGIRISPQAVAAATGGATGGSGGGGGGGTAAAVAGLIPGVDYNPGQNRDRNYDELNKAAQVAASIAMTYFAEKGSGRGAGAGEGQIPAGAYNITVNAGVVGSENIIVDAVQNALNEIARRGYTTTYAGAIAV